MNPKPDAAGIVPSIETLCGFEPDASRVRFLDQRTRSSLADSLRYIMAQADGSLDIPQAEIEGFLECLEAQSVSPLVFSLYRDAVFAIEDNEITQASALLRELVNLPLPPQTLVIKDLGDPAKDAVAARYAGFINDDPSAEMDIFPPSAEASAECRSQIQDALALMERADPLLEAEVRALLREIILAAGGSDPKKMTFDGASSFMLWGGILINSTRRDGAIGMVQMLAHESAHNLLFGIGAEEALVANSTEELFPSPLRSDPRPMDGIYHATFVTARMHRAVKHLLESGELDAAAKVKAQQDLSENARLFARGIETVQKHAILSPLGEKVIQGASDYMSAAG